MPSIVAMADTHGNHERLVVPPADILVHAGDLTGFGTREQVEESLAWLQSLPHRHKIFVAGNHDFLFENEPELAERLTREAGLIYLRDSEVTVEGLRFWGAPWQPRFFDWAFNLDRGEPLAAKWRLIPEGVDVVVTHGPPAGYGDRCDDGRRVGCVDLLEHLKRVKPKLNLFGHIHEDGGQWHVGPTRVVNCTVSECTLPPTVLTL
ncbi:MAG: metallophosphatase domain-containing protein [Myxococcaceae bacterium]|nr:metallophosphatase domain-containing protein [Myxococcaceae bacterium]